MHPNHQNQLQRLGRVEGQVRGVMRMVEEQRYCVDIVSQIRAATAALRAVERSILEGHIRHCVGDAMRSGEEAAIQTKIDEIMALVARMPD